MIDGLYKALNDIGNTSSRTEKIALIKANLNTPYFVDTLTKAYNPFITFGLTSDRFKSFIGWAQWEVGNTSKSFQDMVDLLYKLSGRELTGDAAVQEVLQWQGEALGPLLLRILDKDLDIGLGVSTINSALKGSQVPLVPVFEAMLAHKFEIWKDKQDFVVQPKLDGMRCLALIRNNVAGTGNKSVVLLSRNGKDINSAKKIEDELMALNLPDCILDGELLSADNNFLNTISLARRKEGDGEGLIYHMFDILHDIPCGVPYEARMFKLMEVFGGVDSPYLRVVDTALYREVEPDEAEEHIFKMYQDFRAKGYEGAIVKLAKSHYLPGRSKNWMKLKNEETQDVPITGVFEGEGKYINMLGGFQTPQGKVGSGFSDAQRQEWWTIRDKLIGKTIEVEFHEKTPDGMFRHPRFVRFRGDKDE